MADNPAIIDDNNTKIARHEIVSQLERSKPSMPSIRDYLAVIERKQGSAGYYHEDTRSGVSIMASMADCLDRGTPEQEKVAKMLKIRLAGIKNREKTPAHEPRYRNLSR